MSIREVLDDDPDKGWQLYLNNIDRAAENDVEGFSNGLVFGEETAKGRPDSSEAMLLQEVIRTIPEE